jgi:hypothetical protein
VLISQFFEYVLHLTKETNVGLLNELVPFYTFCWEVGNYLFLSEGHNISLCIYSFCNLPDAEKVMSLPYEQAIYEYGLILSRKQIRGEVVVPNLVCGKLSKISKEVALKKWEALGAKKVLFHKAKLNKFFLISL